MLWPLQWRCSARQWLGWTMPPTLHWRPQRWLSSSLGESHNPCAIVMSGIRGAGLTKWPAAAQRHTSGSARNARQVCWGLHLSCHGELNPGCCLSSQQAFNVPGTRTWLSVGRPAASDGKRKVSVTCERCMKGQVSQSEKLAMCRVWVALRMKDHVVSGMLKSRVQDIRTDTISDKAFEQVRSLFWHVLPASHLLLVPSLQRTRRPVRQPNKSERRHAPYI